MRGIAFGRFPDVRSCSMLAEMRQFFCLAALALAAPLCAAEPEREADYEWQSERLHAPVPLYTFAWRDLWPRSIENPGPDVIVGCESRVAFGDWHFTPNPADSSGSDFWLRIANYGVFHCAANLYKADAREEVDAGDFSRGLFARIGEGRANGKTYELWALQEGFVPGSSYMLLARAKGEDDGIVARFDVLQVRCPSRWRRRAEDMDVWLTRYCAVENRDDLLAFARRMLREPFLGELRREEETGPDAEAPDPSISGS